MQNQARTAEMETVVVTLRGVVLDSASFWAKDEAEAYKGGVRRWATEKGIMVGVWSVKGPGAGAASCRHFPLLARAS